MIFIRIEQIQHLDVLASAVRGRVGDMNIEEDLFMQIKKLAINWQSICRLLVISGLTSCANANVINPQVQVDDKQQILTSHMECGDLLRRFGPGSIPDSIEFINCSEDSEGEPLKSARYRVRGTNAEKIEDFLQREYSMSRLHFVCCGWESEGRGHGFFSSNGHTFTVIMHSLDTAVNDRAAWSEIPFFYIEVEVGGI